jgi:hypothetical protein
MEILRAVDIAKREWENIRVSLERCGDIGEFSHEDGSNRRLNGVASDLRFIRNILGMENKYPTHGYFSPEASYVFSILAAGAGRRLGLRNELARSFGSGYSTARTGWLEIHIMEDRSIVKQWLFFKFFSLGTDDFTWDFNSAVVKRKLKLIFDRFVDWQDNPSAYFRDIIDNRAKLEALRRSLSMVLSYPEVLLRENLAEFQGSEAAAG